MNTNQLFNQKVTAKGRTYFINLKLTVENKKYIVINEIKRKADGTSETSRVMLFEDCFIDFMNAFNDVVKYNGQSKKKTINEDDLAKLRETYPNAYTPWTEEDDKNLESLFSYGKSTEELSEFFQRQPGAIEARVKKLNLLVEKQLACA